MATQEQGSEGTVDGRRPGEMRLTRRRALIGGGLAAGAAILAGCGAGATTATRAVGPGDPAVARREAQLHTSGRVRSYTLTARPTRIDLGGPVVSTWAYNDTVPGPLIRAQPGDRMRIQVNNGLPEGTSVHWHGLAIDNAMDGVPPLTQKEIASGSGQLYDFVLPTAGTYWYHPHVGLQLDRGLYGAFLIDDPADAGSYDVEFVVVLDDWVDGIDGRTPDSVYAGLRSGSKAGGSGMGGSGMGGLSGMGGMGAGASSGMGGMGGMSGMGGSTGSPLGGDPADVTYPYYLINGRIAAAATTLTARPGQRARIRLINSAASTPFQVALGGHRMTVTHTDGYPVAPVTVDTLVLGMAERYDVTVTLGDGAFPLVAVPLGGGEQALAVIRTGVGAAPSPAV